MELWFTSDTHFGHENIIKYCNRPFANAQEMDEILVSRWNERVKPSDHIYHLGDVTMARNSQGRGLEILARLNGHKRLIMGNHDHFHVKHYMVYFEKVMAMWRINDFWLTHVPVHHLSLGSCKANVHGHTHTQNYPPAVRYKYVNGVEDRERPYVTPYINISVEQTNYRPINMEELRLLVGQIPPSGV